MLLVLVLVVLSLRVGDPQSIDIPSLAIPLSMRIDLLVPRNIVPGIVIVPRRGRSDLVLLPVAVHDFGQVLVEPHPAPGHGTRCRIGSSVMMLVLVEDRGVHALAVSIVSGVELVAVDDVVVATIALVVPRRRVAAAVTLHVVPVTIIVVVSSRGHAVEANSARRFVGREGQGVALSGGGTEAQGVKGQLAGGAAAAAAVARDGGDQDDGQGGDAGDGADDDGDVTVGRRGRGAGRRAQRGGGGG